MYLEVITFVWRFQRNHRDDTSGFQGERFIVCAIYMDFMCSWTYGKQFAVRRVDCNVTIFTTRNGTSPSDENRTRSIGVLAFSKRSSFLDQTRRQSLLSPIQSLFHPQFVPCNLIHLWLRTRILQLYLSSRTLGTVLGRIFRLMECLCWL